MLSFARRKRRTRTNICWPKSTAASSTRSRKIQISIMMKATNPLPQAARRRPSPEGEGWVRGCLQLFDHRRHDLEQIARDAVVGDLEDRRFGILVDRHDRARALHADDVLDGAGDAEREIELRRDRLSRAADLPIHRQPARIADRTRRRDLGAERLGQLLRERDVLFALDAAADGDDALGLREVDGLLRFLERRFGLLTDVGARRASRRRREPARRRLRASPDRRGSCRSGTSRDAAPVPAARRRPRASPGTSAARTRAPPSPCGFVPVQSVMIARSSRAASFGAKSRV